MDRRVTLSESFNGYHPVDPSSHCSHMGRGNRHWVIIEAEDTVQTVISSTNSKHLVVCGVQGCTKQNQPANMSIQAHCSNWSEELSFLTSTENGPVFVRFGQHLL
ncbi:hypothetical protein CLF_110764 [Clonorchis sinensis]|uniref:Uncharacterized protein n=1 Tax=Clonorchis sinensis TaxID=79923 RepID=G7YL45_CLOSI|nr:hypothetical protein CLF_110764 [Clonorchis sinensis]